jgi:ABC-2 type transport system ATP-binding protein
MEPVPTASSVLRVQHLGKSFGGFVAIDDVSFTLERGEIVGFLGPNGAGKSTTLFCILGLIERDAGSIEILGRDIRGHRSEVLQRTNFCSAEFTMAWNLSVGENLLVFARLYGVPHARQRIAELTEMFDLAHLRNKLIRELSLGQRARANLCKAFLNRPRLLLLDEPMASMDPDVVDRGITLIRQIQQAEQISIVYTSHNMWEIEQLASKIIFINHGRVVAQGTPLELTRNVLDAGSSDANLREVFIQISRRGLEEAREPSEVARP